VCLLVGGGSWWCLLLVLFGCRWLLVGWCLVVFVVSFVCLSVLVCWLVFGSVCCLSVVVCWLCLLLVLLVGGCLLLCLVVFVVSLVCLSVVVCWLCLLLVLLVGGCLLLGVWWCLLILFVSWWLVFGGVCC